MRKTELTENGNFCSVLLMGNGNGKLPFIFYKRKTEIFFLGRQTINANGRCFFSQVPIYAYTFRKAEALTFKTL